MQSPLILKLAYLRMLAFLCDLSVSLVVAYVSYFFSWSKIISSEQFVILLAVIHFVISSFFFLFYKKGSLGYKLVGLEIKKKSNDEIGLKLYMLKNMLFCIVFFGSFYQPLLLFFFLVDLISCIILFNGNFLIDVFFKVHVLKSENG